MNEAPENYGHQAFADGTLHRLNEKDNAPAPGTLVDLTGKPGEKQGDNGRETNEQKELSARIGRAERWMIFLTALTAFATVGQVYIAYVNSQSSADQFNQMKSVADRMEGAATSFAGNAGGINQSMQNAVGELTQAAKMEAARKASDENARKERRPYIWHDALQIEDSYSQFTGIRVYYTNYGRSPALGLSSTGHVFCGKDALSEAYRYLEKIRQTRRFDTLKGVLPPGINAGLPTPNRGYDTFVTDQETPQEKQLCQGSSPVLPRITVGAWEYYDIEGDRYYGEFCNGIHLGTKRGYDASGNCDEHNDAR
jgi:hypothetical protein